MTFRRPVSSGWNEEPSSRIDATRPGTWIWPDVGAVVPARILKSVLFPDPFSPMRPRTAPGATPPETFRRAWISAWRERPVAASTRRSRGVA